MILQISREIVPAKGELHRELTATRETARAREEEGRPSASCAFAGTISLLIWSIILNLVGMISLFIWSISNSHIETTGNESATELPKNWITLVV